MSSVCQYMTSAFGRTLWQFAALFAVPCVLAVALQWVGAKIRRNGVGWLGNAYWYLVAPGVACHETGHAAGCLLTGCRIVKFVPFTRSDDKRLGYVLHDVDGRELYWDGERCEPAEDRSIDTYEDHRMALGFAPLAMTGETVTINNPMVVTKSYPHYWDDLRKAGFNVTDR